MFFSYWGKLAKNIVFIPKTGENTFLSQEKICEIKLLYKMELWKLLPKEKICNVAVIQSPTLVI